MCSAYTISMGPPVAIRLPLAIPRTAVAEIVKCCSFKRIPFGGAMSHPSRVSEFMRGNGANVFRRLVSMVSPRIFKEMRF
jgi:hypothetical protein